jgi:hypothetical protein
MSGEPKQGAFSGLKPGPSQQSFYPDGFNFWSLFNLPTK